MVESQFGSCGPSVLKEYDLGQYKNPFLAYPDEVTNYSPLGCAETPLSQWFSDVMRTYRYEFDDPNAPMPGPVLRRCPRGSRWALITEANCNTYMGWRNCRGRRRRYSSHYHPFRTSVQI